MSIYLVQINILCCYLAKRAKLCVWTPDPVFQGFEGKPVRTYVMQVATGRELKTVDLAERVLDDARRHGEEIPMAAFFVPRYRLQKKVRGAWETVEELLTPSYVYVRASRGAIDALAQSFARVPAFIRVLAQQDGTIVPLSADEEDWLRRLTGEGHVVEPSIGVMEGDRVVVTEGPLAGMESHIVRIDRHKRLAYVEVQLMGRTKLIKVGIEIVRKTDGCDHGE